MSDTYLPELVELDSYWQKAVQDAIRDTIKGEEKLQKALRNRKKINEKLRLHGLKPILSPLYSNKSCPSESEPVGSQNSDSEMSVDSTMEESQGNSDSDRSTSRSREVIAFAEEKQKSPNRPFFGNGSLEKIKKSQNSFNYEPMGDGWLSEEASEFEKNEKGKYSWRNPRKERNKNIQWLHVRNHYNFENSDSESTNAGDESGEKVHFRKQPFATNKNYFKYEKSVCRPDKEEKSLGTSEKLQNQQNISKEKEDSRSPSTTKHKDLERRLHLALAKREILNKRLKGPAKSNTFIEVSRSRAKIAEKRRREKKQLSSFINFYLEVYRELNQVMPVKRIAEEAARRWRFLNMKEKAAWADGTKNNLL